MTGGTLGVVDANAGGGVGGGDVAADDQVAFALEVDADVVGDGTGPGRVGADVVADDGGGADPVVGLNASLEVAGDDVALGGRETADVKAFGLGVDADAVGERGTGGIDAQVRAVN